jgi:hypothetical protein
MIRKNWIHLLLERRPAGVRQLAVLPLGTATGRNLLQGGSEKFIQLAWTLADSTVASDRYKETKTTGPD